MFTSSDPAHPGRTTGWQRLRRDRCAPKATFSFAGRVPLSRSSTTVIHLHPAPAEPWQAPLQWLRGMLRPGDLPLGPATLLAAAALPRTNLVAHDGTLRLAAPHRRQLFPMLPESLHPILHRKLSAAGSQPARWSSRLAEVTPPAN